MKAGAIFVMLFFIAGFGSNLAAQNANMKAAEKAERKREIALNKTSFGLAPSLTYGPVFGQDLFASAIMFQIEARAYFIGLDLGFTKYFGQDIDTKNWEDVYGKPFPNGLLEADKFLFHSGLNYTIFGPRWDITLGPGLAFQFEEPVILNPYFQVRYNWQIFKRGATNKKGEERMFVPFLRAGYRIDLIDDDLIKANFIKNYTGSDRYFTHMVYVGIQIGFDNRGYTPLTNEQVEAYRRDGTNPYTE